MRKIFLSIITSLVVVIGIILASKPFAESLNPSAKANNNNHLFVALDKIPNEGFYEIEYQFYKVFIADNLLRAYRIPTHYRKGYGLPDPTWHRPFIQCLNFVFEDGWFQCKDFDQSHYYSKIIKWDKFGNTIEGSWMPNLESITFEKGYNRIVFGSITERI